MSLFERFVCKLYNYDANVNYILHFSKCARHYFAGKVLKVFKDFKVVKVVVILFEPVFS